MILLAILKDCVVVKVGHSALCPALLITTFLGQQFYLPSQEGGKNPYLEPKISTPPADIVSKSEAVRAREDLSEKPTLPTEGS